MNGQIKMMLNGEEVIIMGGPYLEKPVEIAGVKLAKELNEDCDIDLPIADFSIPDELQTRIALSKSMQILNREKVIYIGCMGGIGRTGLFMALLVNYISTYEYYLAIKGWRGLKNKIKNIFGSTELDAINLFRGSPISEVRRIYLYNAVETKEQENFIENFEINFFDVNTLT